MKKIKILFGITVLLILLYLAHFASYFFLADFYNGLAEATEDKLVFGAYDLMISLVQTILIFIGLLMSLKCLYVIIKEGFFTDVSKKLMHWTGIIFFVSGIMMCILDIIRLSSGKGDGATIIGIIMLDFLFTLLGFVILIVADMAQTGYQLKSENDLTI